MMQARNQGYCGLIRFVEGRRSLQPGDEDLSPGTLEKKKPRGCKISVMGRIEDAAAAGRARSGNTDSIN
jgi:hypothetical protein